MESVLTVVQDMVEILQVSLAFCVWIWPPAFNSEIDFQERIICDM